MSQDHSDHSLRLNQVIAEYLEAVEAGALPDRDDLLTEHPELADELRSFFTEHDRMRVAAGLSEEATLPPAAAGEAATLPPQDTQEDATLAPATGTNEPAQLGKR